MTFSITRLYRNQLGRDYQSHAGISGQLSGSEFGGYPKFRWSKWNAKECFFRWDDLDDDFFSWKLLNFVWFDHFSNHFDFDFGWFWMHEFNLMIEKLKRRKLLGINIASEPSYILPKHPLVKPLGNRAEIVANHHPHITRQVCKENTIVNMDTGLGKTLVAVMSTLVMKFIEISSLLRNFGCWPASWHFQCN